MKRIGLSRKDYWRFLVGSPEPANKPAISTEAAAGQLRSRGYDATANKLKALVGDVVDGSEHDATRQPAWTQDKIEEAAEYFEAKQKFNWEAAFLNFYGLTMAASCQALRDAHQAAIDEDGPSKLLGGQPNQDLFRLTIEPAFGKRPARITYALLDEVRHELKKASA
jgi:hypothetical protein